ncbi:unnamed protein product [Zymoseptoria tritici ST99CH_3D1]|nr:unnamed protein product [Zymoseptoria tritici ST99CH_3D1]
MGDRASKRRRTGEASSTDATSSSTADKHALFTEWSRSRGVFINSVKPAALPGRGLGLITTSAIRKGSEIIIVPEKAMFKSNPSIVGKKLSPKSKSLLRKASHHAHMALSLMSAMSTPSSSYFLWKSTWPTPEDFTTTLPIFWPHEMADRLPESMQGPLRRQREEFDRDWEFVQEAMQLMKKEWSKREFEYYWAIVNSRSFHFDQKSGKLGAMVLCPFIDYLNHGPTGAGAEVNLVKGKGYVLEAERDYAIGEEVLISYGSHSNEKLLLHYGFLPSASPPSPDDSIMLDSVILPKLRPSIRTALEDAGFLGSYAYLPSTQDICFRTQAAMRAVNGADWEHFVATGEDSGKSLEDDCRGWLKPVVQESVDFAKERVTEMDGELLIDGAERAKTQLCLIRERWQQIVSALDDFS